MNLPDAHPSLIAKFEMAITADDLRRLYPYIPGGETASFDGHSAISGESQPRGWCVSLSNPRTRAVGPLLFPVADVNIEAWGYEKPEFEGFLDRFHLAYRRGGG